MTTGYADSPQQDGEGWAGLRSLPTATLHEAAGRSGALPGAIQSLVTPVHLVGRALPVQVGSGDNLQLHYAVAKAEVGDVLVVSTGGAHEFGYWGEILTVAAMQRGITGLVIDGCVRDTVRIAQLGFPVFFRGRCIKGTIKNHDAAGSVGCSITIGDIPICRGDAVIGDDDGVVIIGQDSVDTVVASSLDRERYEAEYIAKLKSGATTLELMGLE